VRAVLALLALGGAGAVAYLILASPTGGRGAQASRPPSPSTAARPSSAQVLPLPLVAAGPSAPTFSSRLALASGAASAAEASPTSPAPSEFDARFDDRVGDGRKAAIRELLADWRTGRLSPEQDRRVDDALPSLDEAEVVKAAGHVLLEAATTDAQRDGLLAHLAAAGSEDAADRLLAAAARPDLRREAIAALATVSDPRSLTRLAAAASSPGQERDVLEAIAAALRNMDTEKAREVERRLRSELEGR